MTDRLHTQRYTLTRDALVHRTADLLWAAGLCRASVALLHAHVRWPQGQQLQRRRRDGKLS